MFNNIIYFIIVLLIFNINFPDGSKDTSFFYSSGMMFLSWLVLAAYSRLGFRRLLLNYGNDSGSPLTSGYYRAVFRLSIFAVFIFSLDVYIFHLKYWLQMMPFVRQFSVLQGVFAIALFIFYLITIWYFSYPAYKLAFQAKIEKRSFIISNFKLNVPVIFPWLILSLAYDLIALSPWSGPESFLGRPEGQMTFFSVFLAVLMVFMPRLIQYWWGCRPVESSEKADAIKSFLEKMKFRYRNILTWPIFEGRMMTAGIMGIVARYRYLLVTDSLMEVLNQEELKAVMAHEVGHSKYRHMFFYVLFFLGYMILSFGLFDLFFYILASHPYFIELLGKEEASSTNLFYLALSVPILISIFVYFRFVMGYFMRNFERQADLYSARTMGSPLPAISALEKIALMSGKSRDIPSWHHFSVRQRVDCLWRFLKEPKLVKRHNLSIAVAFTGYLIVMTGLIYAVNSDLIKKNLGFRFLDMALSRQLIKEPGNIAILQNLATVYHDMERYKDAMELYEKILIIDDKQATALNNLAWLLITAPDREMIDPERALALAEKAVSLERLPVFLDTLAEAYYANGQPDKAIKIINEAIEREPVDDGYYRDQLEKYKDAQAER